MSSLVWAYQPGIGQVEKLLLKSNESISSVHIQKSHPIISDRPSGTKPSVDLKSTCYPCATYRKELLLKDQMFCGTHRSCLSSLFSLPRYCFRHLHKLSGSREVMTILGTGGLRQSSIKHYKVFYKTVGGAPRSRTQTPFFNMGSSDLS